ncbi:MAG TPA: chemotaxis-specific protein-glutamate methyltransferase CheB [Bacillota bacterium]|nr:chemotaxis-specific protein-glutamate methyltransferase CheB [Bacillota bacterium]HPT88440.1 chemotaxis-specific protein-glutamate methyltransferase CheB [Bacillota bacterium]
MDKLRALIVDDSIVYRRILTAAVESTGVAVALQTASNGILALERLEQQAFDVILLDVNMPELDGIQTLRKIRAVYPDLAVIMVSSTGMENAEVTMQALEAGALDFIVKPLEEDYDRNLKILSDHLKVLFAQIRIRSYEKRGPTQPEKPRPVVVPKLEIPKSPAKLNGVDLVLIASSTGGPVAVEQIFSKLEPGFSKPILVVQHMPPDFTKVFAQNLDNKSVVKVIEGRRGDVVRAGQAIVAPGGYHMTVRPGEHAHHLVVELDQTPLVRGVRPAADVLFKSVANCFKGGRVLAVVLTGMGSDGTDGVAELKRRCQCYCITQSEASCVVYGMPRSVVEAGLSDETVDITMIASRIQEIVKNGS